MNYSKIITIFVLVGFTGLLLSSVVFGVKFDQGLEGTGILAPTTIGTADNVISLIGKVIKYVYIVFFIIAVAFILFAAFTYLSAGGDPEKVGEAKNKLIYAAVAIIVALLSVALVNVIDNFVSTS